MRPSLLLVPVLVALSLACGGRGARAVDKACEVACNEAEVHCEAKCPNGDAGGAVCEAACTKAEDACVTKCQK